MRRLASRIGWRLAPEYMGERAHRYRLRLVEQWGDAEAAREFIREHGECVQGGPFKGMRYVPAPRVAHVQRLLGEYEQELHPWIEEVLRGGPSRFIDIGAEDGYYAVGVARMGLRVDAFELSLTARRQMEALARINETVVHLHGRVTGKRLRALAPSNAFVLCDIEGTEADLFDAETVQALRDSTLIVEVHERARPGVERLLRERFAATHDVDRREPGDGYHRDDPTPWLMFTPHGVA